MNCFFFLSLLYCLLTDIHAGEKFKIKTALAKSANISASPKKNKNICKSF